MRHTYKGLVYRSVGSDGSSDNGSGGGSGFDKDGSGASVTDGSTPAGKGGEKTPTGGGERRAPAGGGEKGRGGGGGGGRRKYNIPSSELKKLDQLFLSEDDKLTYDRRQTPSYTAGMMHTTID